jgi:hypothetical protein
MEKEQLPEGRQWLHSCLFSLRNPEGVPRCKFAPKEETKDCAICCMSDHCTVFGGGANRRESEGYDIVVDDICDFCLTIATWTHSHTRIGNNAGGRTTYANEPDFEYVFTGSEALIVKDIE